MPSDFQKSSRIESLKQELKRLSDEQAEAYGRAVFVGMTVDEAKKCNERREIGMKLVEELTQLCAAK